MKRIVLMVTVALVMAAMLVLAGPASAQAGCQGFGQGYVAQETPHSGVVMFAPNVDDAIFSLKAENC